MHYRKRKLLFAAYNLAGWLTQKLGAAAYWYQPQLRRFLAIGDRKKNILILCHGNICRSPYLEQKLSNLLNPEHYALHSAGLKTTSGKPANTAAVRVAKEQGIDLSEHRTKQVELAEINAADLILLMDPTHLLYLKELSPEALGRSVLFGGFSLRSGLPLVISDPYAKSDEIFRQCYHHLNTATESFIAAVSP